MVIWYRDKGEYTCSAENGVGEPISKTVKLNINGKHINHYGNVSIPFLPAL